MTDAVEKENCLAEINEVLDQMKQDNCHPEPDCWEEAMAWLNGHLKECENLDDPEKARDCMEKGHQQFEAMNE
jgi:ArsR family metal-binding transcriptional regulator